MRDLLTKRDIQLTKSLGQNFLHDANQLERIVVSAELTPEDKVLEIGPGLGPLTELLLQKAGHVFAIEKDTRLVEVLNERFVPLPLNPEMVERTPHPGPLPIGSADSADAEREKRSQRLDAGTPREVQGFEGKFELLHADALRFLEDEPRDWSAWKLVANLPYSVASPILVELAAGARAPQKIVVTLQMEVAQRLMARTDDDDYGILTLLVQLDFAPRSLFKIPPGCFFPSPDVDSACVILDRREQPLLPENLRAMFRRIVKRSFSQRRKMMLKLLKQDWPKEKLEAIFAELKISPLERAEKLSLEQFVEVTKLLCNQN